MRLVWKYLVLTGLKYLRSRVRLDGTDSLAWNAVVAILEDA